MSQPRQQSELGITPAAIRSLRTNRRILITVHPWTVAVSKFHKMGLPLNSSETLLDFQPPHRSKLQKTRQSQMVGNLLGIERNRT